MDHDQIIKSQFARQASAFSQSGLTLSSREYLDWRVGMLPLEPHLRVLDVAAGTGILSRAIASRVGEVVAVHLTPQMLEEARRETAKNGFGNKLFAAPKYLFSRTTFDEALVGISEFAADTTDLELALPARVDSHFVGLSAGSYPALFLSSFKPISIIRGGLARGAKGSRFRSALVVFQFAVSAVLIVLTLVVLSQMKYMRLKALGFDKQDVLVLAVQNEDVRRGLEAFKTEVLRIPGVTSAGGSSMVPGEMYLFNVSAFPEGHPRDQALRMDEFLVDYQGEEPAGRRRNLIVCHRGHDLSVVGRDKWQHCRACRREVQARYAATPAGGATRKRFSASPKSRIVHSRYNTSPKGAERSGR